MALTREDILKTMRGETSSPYLFYEAPEDNLMPSSPSLLGREGLAVRFEWRGASMIGEKVQHFQGKGTDLNGLQGKIESYLKSDGFSTQTSPSSSHGLVIQAKKGGFLRGAVDADRALSIVISGDPNDFTVRIGIGKWLKNLGVAALETLLISDLFLVVDVAESAWNLEIEDKLAKQIESLVG